MVDDTMFLVGFILLVAIVMFVTQSRVESMTNKDLVSVLQTHGTPDAKKKKKDEPSELEIYGPKAEKVVPTSNDSKTKGGNTSGSYPDIYGPDIPSVPGTKPKPMPGKHASDQVDDETYDFNPDLQKAFPTEGPPQPFLTDFSKFQH